MEERDALDLLREDHDRLRSLVRALAAATTRAVRLRTTLLDQMSGELRTHAQVELELFYPAVRAAAENERQARLVADVFEERGAGDELMLPELEKTRPSSLEFAGRARVLKEPLEHQTGEEERVLFSVAKQLLSKAALRELGARMQERKHELHARPVH